MAFDAKNVLYNNELINQSINQTEQMLYCITIMIAYSEPDASTVYAFYDAATNHLIQDT